MYTFTVQSSPPLLILHSPCLQTFYPPSAHFISPSSAPSPLSLATGRLLRLLPPLFPLTLSGFFSGMLEVFEPGALNYFTFPSSHPVDLICSQESNLNSSSSFRIPGFSALRSDRTHSWFGILTPDATHASGSVVTLVREGLSFSELSTSLSSLDPYSDYVGVNISLNNSSSFLFLNVYAPPLFAPPQQMAEPIPSLPSEISLFWRT